MKEQEQYETIKRLVETSGNKRRATLKLNCTMRHLNRLIQGYKIHGKSYFSHGNKKKPPANKLSDTLKQQVITLYQTTYRQANISHFRELLEEREHINISESTIRNWFSQEDIISPQAHKKTKRGLRKKLDLSIHTPTQKTATPSDTVQNPHPRRPRCKYSGEMLQMDASEFHLPSGERCYVHVAIDDATGIIAGAYLDHYETLQGYYHVLHQILSQYGIPYLFYTDKRTVFTYSSKKKTNQDLLTHFACACAHMGIDIQTTSSPQAKGRVERSFRTIKSRFFTLLQLEGVTTQEQANQVLTHYINMHNSKFARQHHTGSVYEQAPPPEEVNLILSRVFKRTIDRGNCIRFHNSYYIPVDANHSPAYFKPKTTVLVIEAFDKNLYANINNVFYALDNIPESEIHSRYFDNKPKPVDTHKKRYIPPMSHPWKQYAYEKRLRASQNIAIRR